MVSRNSKKTKCPSCTGESTLRNSRARSTKERIIKAITWFELYRCKKCGWRGWKTNIVLEQKAIKKIIIYTLLMIITAFVVYNLLRLVV
ncbi:MAG: hypothetical protein MUE93_00900 [Ignavibacteriaceae bacterium]|jgi:predicted RNA-binding Zn-ribbon protein involved in translation (DUF1610 family)|nr:hypothetical protein [Ignavibacteriaceae bacterium]MCU0405970.1 hypothetical protein [Ignavibacteriaceae bacterium]MCU0413662.1 hypothetical protein [Ignavibacteriaceae bacterium]